MNLDLYAGRGAASGPKEAPSEGSFNDEREALLPRKGALLQRRVKGYAVDEITTDPAGTARHPQGPPNDFDPARQLAFFPGCSQRSGQEDGVT